LEVDGKSSIQYVCVYMEWLEVSKASGCHKY
jgi:hypothetical protein